MLNWLADLVSPLNEAAFTVGGTPTSWAELLGFLTGGLCVWLTVRAHISNFPVGIANSAFFLILFATAHLWADSSLQVVYIVLGFIGWWQWLHGGEHRTRLVTTRASRMTIVACLAFVVIGTIGLTMILRAADDSAPFWDALTTCISLAAQYLLNTRRIETWLFWIAADCIYIPLYFSRDLNLTAVIYAVFLGLCVAGWRAWRRDLATRESIREPNLEPVPT